jgi:hypothetical protein
MLLARLVTVRPGYMADEDRPQPAAATASSQHWLTRLTAIFSRKRPG